MSGDPVGRRLRRGDEVLGGWLAVPSDVSAEAMARVGFDYVCVDLQHGAISMSDARSMIGALLLGGTSPIVRVPSNDAADIGRALDAGAHAVIVPMVDSAAEAAAAVSAARYATEGGRRSWGPGLAGPRVDGYLTWATEHVSVIPMIETRTAVDAVEEIVAVDGVHAIYVGPADLSLTLGLAPTDNDGHASFDDAVSLVADACRS
ncbi:MAG: aldolase/citrate lyase family protein, partial [Actinomycetota bacterium]